MDTNKFKKAFSYQILYLLILILNKLFNYTKLCIFATVRFSKTYNFIIN